MRTIFGCEEWGDKTLGPFKHSTGQGWVGAHVGHYFDALHNKKNVVVALIAETFGGVTPTVEALIRRLDKVEGQDGTKYGRYSTQSFFVHHSGSISMQIVQGDAEVLMQGVSKEESRRTRKSWGVGGG